ncbi:MAG TPA: sulfur oxidation c-type cytochrome SoxA, partial [Methylomirabilota bacterium]|nr:sulfur oxidation c-type cytochrome SoxA [Methylomirabilota bacterium]
HLVPGADVWPAGSVGPDLSTLGDRGLRDAYLYALIYDARTIFPGTTMPPWGATGALTPPEIADLVAFLQTLRGPRPPERDPERDPTTRAKPPGFGDNLDPTNNPAVVLAESAADTWRTPGPSGRACASCHGDDPAAAMKGVAPRYPRFVAAYGRVAALEDLLTLHGPPTTGAALLAQSPENLALTMLVKMASNGLPVAVDVTSPEARAALARGRESFYRRVGERNHACADCHTPDRGANRFLGGRLLADVTVGLTRHFPTWRTSQADVWDMRRRMQWCMTPLGTNMLAADAVEYAELELYLTSFDNGKPLSVPGIRH